MNELEEINNSMTSKQPTELFRIIFYGDCTFKNDINKRILIATVQLIKDSHASDQSLP